ncbi:hypothetical protein GGF44_001026 [Coemansia sp. RSA 1694]|nr:hypothetical protein GGF44_001026 [Coemansia sp. RSA 1694]
MVRSLYSQDHTLKLSLAEHELKENPPVDTGGRGFFSVYRSKDYTLPHLSKRLNIHVELGCIYSGMALKLLSRAPGKDCIFPAVRSIILLFSINPDDTGDDIDALVVQANTTAFVQRLFQLAPRFHECHTYAHYHKELSESALGHFNSLVRQLLANVDHLGFSLGYKWVNMDMDFAGICNLVHIDYSFDVYDWPCFQLVRQCAPTLQTLKLRPLSRTMDSGLDLSGLIRDADGSCVAFPCLQMLTFHIRNECDVLRRPSFGPFVAFPVLQHVNLGCDYPFGDNTLFRGNAATLESLKMRMDADAAMMLREHRVFTRASHPRLRSVAIDGANGYVPNVFATYADFMQFVLSIGPRAPVRVLPPIAFEQDVPRALQLLGEHTSIQVLSMEGATLTVLDVVALIKSLPLLSDLLVGVPKLDSHLAGIPKSQLFETLIEGHAPMGRHLRRLVARFSQVPLEDLAEFAMLLASLCPNLDFIDVSNNLIAHFGRHMKNSAASQSFQKYEQLLQRLRLPVVDMLTKVKLQTCPICGYV